MPPRTRTAPSATATIDPPTEAAVVRLPLDKVHPDPRNPRFELGDLSELTASIKDGGVRQPITVYPHPDRPGEWMVLFGHRRRQASLDAGQADIPGIVRDDLDTDHARLIERLIENLDREDLTPVEEATAYEQLVLANVKVTQIAKRTGRSAKEITGRRALMKLQEGTRAKIQARQITVEDAAALVEFAGDKAATKRLEDAAGTSEWRWKLQQERDAAKRKAKRDKTVLDLKAAGVRVITAKDLPGGTWEHSLSRAGLTQDEHAEQHPDGHVAMVDDWSGDPRWYCLDPKVHQSSEVAGPGGEPGDETSPEDSAAKAEQVQRDREQFAADCATAAGIRKAWVESYITGPVALDRNQEGAIAGLVTRLLVEVYYEQGPDQMCGWVGVEPIDTGKGYDSKAAEQQEKQVRDALAKLPGAAGLLTILAAEFETDGLSKTHHWASHSVSLARGGLQRGWLTLLTGSLGYELTDWEREQLKAIDLHQLEHAHDTADAEDDDADGDG